MQAGAKAPVASLAERFGNACALFALTHPPFTWPYYHKVSIFDIISKESRLARLGDVLRGLRGKAGLTQEQLARNSGAPLSSLRSYEQGQRLPSWPAVVRLARALGVSCDVFAQCDEVAPKKARGRPPKKSGG
jgi:DNA-binding XRE family transcriptional regulator